MIRIVKNPDKPTININKVTNNMFIGFICNDHRYAIMAKRTIHTDTLNRYYYYRVNNLLILIGEEHTSARDLLENADPEDAFVFNTRLELMTWLLDS